MTYVYRNSNTGQVVPLEQRDPCLDMLDNWRIIGGPEPADTSGPASAGPARPSEHDNKAAWIEYAVSCGMPESDAKSLSKAALIEEFGEDPDGED
ncbi:hypothetical protein [Nonomuraea sp. NEAU-A123]|uniref:hypothetical protein n=1 Tax=Nonomuraea sp. NEAU-A123 TaxID=2839649 RepID=UPI001BE418FC|nr:hypothetical protein [Nonomuraea sp. NEAU-A123]MBT2234760.1 hypothetical protein [Nonomuraea sp. NEAU-A123]